MYLSVANINLRKFTWLSCLNLKCFPFSLQSHSIGHTSIVCVFFRANCIWKLRRGTGGFCA